MSAIIFAGPSLPPKLRPAADPSLEWRPPVRQGELFQAALARPSIIGIIDGYFEVVPTVWHKEVLWAMAEGIHVYGAASAGALRAAELDSFGMQGIGRVYQDFRDGILEDDDEVAVLHGPEELGYPPITEAMVNIRATLDEAARSGIIAPALAASLTDIAKHLFYKERSYEAMMHSAAAAGLPEAMLQDFADWLPDGRIDQKRLDAEAMLEAIRSHLAAGARPLRVSWRLAETAAWQAARRSATSASSP
jgi:hypothetical protein